MWQDLALAVIVIGFVIGFLPMLLNPKTRIPRVTSTTNATLLYAMALVGFTIPLPLMAACNVVSASAWAYIAWKRALKSEMPEEPEAPQGRGG